MRADWTACGACTSGSTAPPRGATRRASGGAAMTSTTRDEHDANARTDMASRRGVVPWHVDRDDGGDDAAVLGPNAVALPPARSSRRRHSALRSVRVRAQPGRRGRRLQCRMAPMGKNLTEAQGERYHRDGFVYPIDAF